jgi:hypothetical protein
VRSGLCDRDESAAWHRHVVNGIDADQGGIELNKLWSSCRQDIYGARIRMRMRTLHMDNALIFSSFEFGQMRVDRRRFPKVRVHVEKWCIQHREKERGYCAAGRQSSHTIILMKR